MLFCVEFVKTLKDKKTGYGLPFSINYDEVCPGGMIEKSMNRYNGLKVISDSKEYISIYTFESEELTKNVKEILMKIKEKNGFTHRCVDGKFE